MKFYEQHFDRNGFCSMIESGVFGEWATRADAEQAVKDAVGMARLFRSASRHPRDIAKAQAIIDRYEGGK